MSRSKRIAIVLAAVAGVLALWAVLQQLGVGAGYSLLADEGGRAAAARFGTIQTEPYKLEPYGSYAEILARPVFNESRAPEAQAEGGGEEGVATGSTAAPLNVTLTGVIIMPELKLAFVRDNAANTVQRVRLGNPLEGEQSGWRLVELMPRGAVFEGEGLGRQELELSIDVAGAPAVEPPIAIVGIPSQPVDPAVAQAEGQVQQVQPVQSPEPPSDAAARPTGNVTPDAIRQRIEERRRQLREEAQRMMQEQQSKQ